LASKKAARQSGGLTCSYGRRCHDVVISCGEAVVSLAQSAQRWRPAAGHSVPTRTVDNASDV